jgi:putative hemolysin
MRTRTGVILALVLSALLCGCACAPMLIPTPTEVGMANPASVYCEEQGGALEIRDEADGQVGYCIFPDGSECEEWAFFRGECAPAATLAPTEVEMANPASVYCEEQGGTLEIRDEADGQVGYCKFADGSECEEWAFFRGECAPTAACEEARATAEETFGVAALATVAEFKNPITDESGPACQVTLTGDGTNFENPFSVAESLKAALQGKGWTEDTMYVADGPTGTAFGMRKDTTLCVTAVMWEPSPDADCPEDQPITECDLAPEQMLYTITLNCIEAAE